MHADFREIEAEVRYLTADEGGRKSGVWSGYRGQFHYQGNDYDGFQYFPDLPEGIMVELGTTVRALIRFSQERWKGVHSQHITIGMPFEIREGARVVGRGTVTRM